MPQRRRVVRKTGAQRSKARARTTVAKRAVRTLGRPSIANIRTGGFQGIENKFKDLSRTLVAIGTVWTRLDPAVELCIGGTDEGTGPSDRVGRVYTINQLMVTGMLQRVSSEVDTAPPFDAIIRLVLVWDTQTNGAQLTAADLFASSGVVNEVFAYRNLQFTHRFIVLVDKIFTIGKIPFNNIANNLFAYGSAQRQFRLQKTFTKNPVKIRCSGTGDTVADIQDNSFHLIGCSNQAGWTCSINTRARFTG